MKSVIPVKSGLIVFAGAALMMLQLGISGGALAAPCPAVTVADSKGVAAGKYPQQYAEFMRRSTGPLQIIFDPFELVLQGINFRYQRVVHRCGFIQFTII